MLVKTVECSVAGKKVHLAYTVNAMFDINDIIGEKDMFEILGENDRKNFQAFCEIIAVLAENGEQCRRQAGYPKGETVSANELKVKMIPRDYMDAKSAALQAIMIGLKRGVIDQDEEIDEGLAELEKKENRPEPTS